MVCSAQSKINQQIHKPTNVINAKERTNKRNDIYRNTKRSTNHTGVHEQSPTRHSRAANKQRGIGTVRFEMSNSLASIVRYR